MFSKTYILYNKIYFLFVVMNTETKYVVDFDFRLAEIIAETKYVESLGFTVPELARNVALQVCIY